MRRVALALACAAPLWVCAAEANPQPLPAPYVGPDTPVSATSAASGASAATVQGAQKAQSVPAGQNGQGTQNAAHSAGVPALHTTAAFPVLGAAPIAPAGAPAASFPALGSSAAGAEAPPVSAPLKAWRDVQQGVASWYGRQFHGRKTASGETFDQHALTAAHPTLPFGTVVRVRSLVNDRTVDVRINDRGPYIHKRIIDLSRGAAEALGLIESGSGTKPVVLSIVGEGDEAQAPRRGRGSVRATPRRP